MIRNEVASGNRLMSWKLHSHWIDPYFLMKLNQAHSNEIDLLKSRREAEQENDYNWATLLI